MAEATASVELEDDAFFLDWDDSYVGLIVPSVLSGMQDQDFQYVLDIVESKKYGELKNLKADFGFYTPYNTESRVFQKRVGGGSLLDIGIYPIFAALKELL